MHRANQAGEALTDIMKMVLLVLEGGKTSEGRCGVQPKAPPFTGPVRTRLVRGPAASLVRVRAQ